MVNFVARGFRIFTKRVDCRFENVGNRRLQIAQFLQLGLIGYNLRCYLQGLQRVQLEQA